MFKILIIHREIEVISDGKKLQKLKLFKMKRLYFEDFTKKYNLTNGTMNGSELQGV